MIIDDITAPNIMEAYSNILAQRSVDKFDEEVANHLGVPIGYLKFLCKGSDVNSRELNNNLKFAQIKAYTLILKSRLNDNTPLMISQEGRITLIKAIAEIERYFGFSITESDVKIGMDFSSNHMSDYAAIAMREYNNGQINLINENTNNLETMEEQIIAEDQTKLKERIISGLKLEIANRENKLGFLQDEKTAAEKSLDESTFNNGFELKENNNYVKNLLSARNHVTATETKVTAEQEIIDFLKERLKVVEDALESDDAPASKSQETE